MQSVDSEPGDVCWGCQYREVASHFEGDVGTELFDFYDTINWHFFEGKLPHAFLLTALTAYGRCIGQTKADLTHKPIILIHPSLTTPEDRFYVVLHEAIHVNVDYNLRKNGDHGGKTSHSTPEWIAEVNRIAPMLGYTNVTLGENKVTRLTDTTDKKQSTIKRVNTGTVSYKATFTFPHGVEKETGQPLPDISTFCNAQLDVTSCAREVPDRINRSELAALRTKVTDQAQEIDELASVISKLRESLDYKRRYHSTTAYNFKSWLRKQSKKTPLMQKILEYPFEKEKTSRHNYEEKLRRQMHCSEEEMRDFDEMWIQMLLQS